MKKYILTLQIGMFFATMMLGQTSNTGSSENQTPHAIQADKKELVFKTQKDKDEKIAMMEQRIKMMEEQGYAKDRIQRYYDRLELFKNTRVEGEK